MFWVDILFALFFALALSALLTVGFGWRHPARNQALGTSLLFLFLVLLFTIWAGGVWLRPWGPVVYGTSWLALLLVGLIVSLIILAVVQPTGRPPRTPGEVAEKGERNTAAATAFGAFFWLVLFGLLVATVVGYMM